MDFVAYIFWVQHCLGALAPCDHAVTFYDTVGEGVSTVAGFVAEGLALDERVVVVATAAHRAALDDALISSGVDPDQAVAAGRYLALDARTTLDALLVDGNPDPERFRSVVGPFVETARRDGVRVRFFGEMVALLWEAGDVAGAIALEALWNDLRAGEPFTLLCAYPSTLLDSADVGEVSRMCGQHTVVQSPAGYASARSASGAPDVVRRAETFVPVPEAVSAVRRFVTGVLRSWGEDDLVPDAALVISEMATNAVMHAESAFRAFVERADGVVRIAIEDAGSGMPESLAADGDDLNGRGVAIVEALSARWGWDALAQGKIVWAELTTAPVGTPVA